MNSLQSSWPCSPRLPRRLEACRTKTTPSQTPSTSAMRNKHVIRIRQSESTSKPISLHNGIDSSSGKLSEHMGVKHDPCFFSSVKSLIMKKSTPKRNTTYSASEFRLQAHLGREATNPASTSKVGPSISANLSGTLLAGSFQFVRTQWKGETEGDRFSNRTKNSDKHSESCTAWLDLSIHVFQTRIFVDLL